MALFHIYMSRFALLSGMLVLSLGCSGGGEFSTYPVSGKVTYTDGAPVAGGTITFSNQEKNVSAVGPIAEDGAYHLGTYGENDGAPAGHYRVTVIGTSGYNEPSPVAMKYGQTTSSPLEATVKEEATTVDFQVERAGK